MEQNLLLMAKDSGTTRLKLELKRKVENRWCLHFDRVSNHSVRLNINGNLSRDLIDNFNWEKEKRNAENWFCLLL
jgi:hypothetical protein